MPLTAIMTPLAYGIRLFDVPPEKIVFGHTAWVGSAHVAVNELGDANITQIILLESHRTAHIAGPIYDQLRAAGVKTAVWTKLTGGVKRIVREIFSENCTPDEIRRFHAIRSAERETGTNVIQQPNGD